MLILDCIIAITLIAAIFNQRSVVDSLFLTMVMLLVGIISVNALYEMGLMVSSVACLVGLIWCGFRTFLYSKITA